MKIAIFVDSFYPVLGGMEDATALLARALGEAGHQVDLYVPRFSRRNFTGRGLPAKDLDLGPNVITHHLFSLPLPYWLFAARLIIPTLAGYRLLKKNRPDLIHVQSIWGAGLEALWAGSLLKIPLVGTNHSIISSFSDYIPLARKFVTKLLVRYDAWFYNHCQYVSAPSTTALVALRQNGLTSASGAISNIIDLDNFSPPANNEEKEKRKSEFGLSGRPVVSFAGRFAIEKRGEILLRAIDLVRPSFSDAVLVLAGGGVQQKNWEHLITELKIEKNVKFVGLLSKPQLAKLFQASDAFAIASAVESQGLVALQAMAGGLAVVGVNGQAIPEYVGADNGFIVPVDNYQQLAECLIKLISEPALARELGQNGRKKVEKYSKQNIIKEWEKVYHLTLNSYAS